MVPKVVSNGPGHTSTKKPWSHAWWEMVPTPIQISKPIHRFINPADQSRSISTVNADSLTGEYGWYQRSMSIHLRRITVDRQSSIKNQYIFVVNFIDDTCENVRKNDSLSFWRVNLNPLKKKFTRSSVRNVRINFPTLFLNWYKKPVRFIFRTCFTLEISVRTHRHCENSRTSAVRR